MNLLNLAGENGKDNSFFSSDEYLEKKAADKLEDIWAEV
jgi:hypothetical protein